MKVQGITSLSLMTQTEKYGFIFWKINLIFETFKKWKAVVEIETNLKVKCLKSLNLLGSLELPGVIHQV